MAVLARHDLSRADRDTGCVAGNDPTVAAGERDLVEGPVRRVALRDREHGPLGDAGCRSGQPRAARPARDRLDPAWRRCGRRRSALMGIETTTLGTTGFEISRVGLGAWAIGGGEW